MRTDTELIDRLLEIEQELRELRLSIIEREDGRLANHLATEIRVGDIVRILNPNFGQESVARVTKVNPDSGYYTLKGKRFGLTIIRKRKNLRLYESQE